MKRYLCVLAFFAAACSREPKPPEPAAASSNAAATVGGGELERMTAFSSLKAPSTPGNPSRLTVCVTLYDKSGREVAAEGQFDVTSEIGLSGGMYVHPPMFGALDLPGGTSPLGSCPSAGEVWPDRLAQLRGRSIPIQVKFTAASGMVLTADAAQSF